jgi:DNA-binding MarR family transcriptional regulator
VSDRFPLSTLLSQVLVAFTMEFDNEAERKLTELGSRRFLVSQAMWANLMRFVDDDGIAIRDIPDRAGFPGTPVRTGWMHGSVAGMERWGYVTIGPDPADRRAKPPRGDLIVTPTPAGRTGRAVWRPLADEVEQRWRTRFGADAVDHLRASLVAVIEQVPNELPRYLPVVEYGLCTLAPHLESRSPGARDAAGSPALDLSALLAPVLLLLAVAFERESELSLAISANALRVIDSDGTRVRDVPSATGASKAAISVALGFLDRHGFAAVDADPEAGRAKMIGLTQKGRTAQAAVAPILAALETRWQSEFGADVVEQLRAALEALLANPRLPEGLQPPATGWRAQKPYAKQTAALIADPRSALPHFPLVTHRGGWPDGS